MFLRLSLGVRSDLEGTGFARALKHALWVAAVDPLGLAAPAYEQLPHMVISERPACVK